jgi:hypothetical protein
METIVGFVAGYLVGTRQGREGLERLRASLQSIKNSPEVRKLAAEAVAAAETAVRQASSGGIRGLGDGVTELLVRRAVASREGARAA